MRALALATSSLSPSHSYVDLILSFFARVSSNHKALDPYRSDFVITIDRTATTNKTSLFGGRSVQPISSKHPFPAHWSIRVLGMATYSPRCLCSPLPKAISQPLIMRKGPDLFRMHSPGSSLEDDVILWPTMSKKSASCISSIQPVQLHALP